MKDIFFAVKIQDAAKRAGLEIMLVQTQADALKQAKTQPIMMILDLNDPGTNPLDLIAKLKNDDETRNIPLLGFVSHVQTDLIQAARAKGCDTVLARSAFSQNLPQILDRCREETVN